MERLKHLLRICYVLDTLYQCNLLQFSQESCKEGIINIMPTKQMIKLRLMEFNSPAIDPGLSDPQLCGVFSYLIIYFLC